MNSNGNNTVSKPTEVFSILIFARSVLGGLLMGLANLVPGISGGTMLLAVGIYPRFINAISDITTMNFRFTSISILTTVSTTAALAILLLAGLVKGLVISHRWLMYSLFIGLTLGGLPIVWQMLKHKQKSTFAYCFIGFLCMALLAYFQQAPTSNRTVESGFTMLFLAGIAGASAMILPGISGGYLLLVLGQYVPILSAIDNFKLALKTGDITSALQIGFSVGLPVGLGVGTGIIVVSNFLRLVLDKYESVTLGVLTGLLLGSVIGLWPFQETFSPEMGSVVKGQIVTETILTELDAADYPVQYFRPSLFQIVSSTSCVILGVFLTSAIAKFSIEE
ncbi:hypothetical protein CMK18_03490 [Candidatus Poribacteria bacterium]|nr:hypothetical protein [Candidatus Poribacteria bacterium]